jgi:hypothetical protein
MNRPRARLRGHRKDHAVRGAVQVAVTAAHHTRPDAGAHAGQHAVFWARTAGALDLIADHEMVPDRAESVRADAGTARRLAEGMAAAHTAQIGSAGPVPPAGSAGVALEEASLRVGGPRMGKTTYLGPHQELPDMPDVQVLDLDLDELAVEL